MESDLWSPLLALSFMWAYCLDGVTMVTIQGIGASFPDKVYKGWISTQKASREPYVDVQHTYLVSDGGSSSGRAEILKPNTNITYAGTDVDFTDTEKSQPAYKTLLTIPTLAGAIIIGYNLPGIPDLYLDRAQIVGIFNGSYRNWRDPIFKTTNPNIVFPDTKILPVVRQDNSGTTEAFTTALSSFSTEWANVYGKFKSGLNESYKPSNWKEDVIAYYGQTNAGVAGLIASIRYTVGYLSIADAKDYSSTYLGMAKIGNSAGNFIDPQNDAGIIAAMSSAAGANSDALTNSIVNAPGANSYPLATNTYIVLKRFYNDCSVAVELQRYLEWCLIEPTNEAINTAKSFQMVIPDSTIGEKIEIVLKTVTCGPLGENVWDKMQLQKQTEEDKTREWIIPVAILAPIIIIVIGALSAYLIVQKVKLWRMINANEWDIPIEEVLFYSNQKNRANGCKMRSQQSFTSLDSDQWSQLEDGSAMVDQVIQWPGKWKSHTIGIRLVNLKEYKTLHNSTKRMLLWMRDTIIHQNVLRFHGLTIVDDERYVVSEYCAKGPMLDILQDEKFNINNDIKFSLAMDIVTGMCYLSSHGIVHGNLRAACCLVDSRWQVKIADWEYVHLYATIKNKKTPLKAIRPNADELGSFAASYKEFWTAPEILRNEYNITPNSCFDVYSFSIMLHEIFSRDDPYSEHADTMEPRSIINAIVQNNLRPKHSDDTPVSIRQIMEIAWVEDSTARPSFEQIAKMLKHANPTKKNMLDSMMEAMEEYTVHLEDRVQESTSELQVAKEQAESVFLNIMPTAIARKVMNREEIQAREHNSIGILAYELNLNDLCEDRKGSDTVQLLDKIHREMDLLIFSKPDTFRQRLFGDTVICLTGITKRVGKKQVCRAAQLGMELLELVSKVQVSENGEKLRAKFGLHCGPVVTGIMGENSPQFVMMGNAITTAATLVHSGQFDRILVSENCCKVLQNTGMYSFDLAHSVTTKEGKSMQTFWLVGIDGKKGADDNNSEENRLPELRYTDVGHGQSNGYATPISAV